MRIQEAAWPDLASAKWWDGHDEEKANRTKSIRVRQHADGRRLVYAVAASQWQGERGAHAGFLVAAEAGCPDDASTVRAIHTVAETIDAPRLAAECIAALPAEDLS